MPINEEEPIPEPDPRVERFVMASRHVVGATERVPIRVVVLLVIALVSVTLAPLPINLIGVGAVLLLAIDTASHRR